MGLIRFISLLVLCSTPVSLARAQAGALPTALTLRVPSCATTEALDPDALVRALRVELSSLGVDLREEARAHLVVRCAADPMRLRVSIANDLTGRYFDREVAVPATSEGRVRAVALELVELVRAGWAELAAVDRSAPAVDELVLALAQAREDREALRARLAALERGGARVDDRLSAQRRAIDEHANELRELEPVPLPDGVVVFGRATVDVFGGGLVALAGGEVGVHVPVEAIALVAAVRGSVGRTQHSLGEAEIRTVSAAVSLVATIRSDVLSVSLGPAFRLGWAQAEGFPVDPMRVRGSTVDDLLGSAGAAATLWGWLSREWRLSLDLTLAYAFGGVDALAAEARVGRTRGPLVAIGAGVGFAP